MENNLVILPGKVKSLLDPNDWMNNNPVAEDPIMDALNFYAENHEPSVYEKRDFDRRSKWMKNRVRLSRH